MPDKKRRNRSRGRQYALWVAVAALTAAAQSQAGQGVVDRRTGHLVVAETDLTVPAGGVLLELRRVASSGEDGGGVLGPRWRLTVEKRAAASLRESVREVESGREVYRPDGRLARIEMGNRNVVVLSYDAAGRLVGMDGPAGAAIRLRLDAAGRLVRAQTTAGATAEYRYQNGLLAEVSVKGGAPLRYGYDGQRRVVRIEDPRAGAVQIDYGTRNRVISRRFADGATETLAYDDERREVRITDVAGGVTTITRSAGGTEETIIDPDGRRTQVRFDAQGRTVMVTAAGRDPVRTEYDSAGRITSTGARPLVLRYEYAGNSPLASAILYPDGSRQEYSYDAYQRLTSVREGSETLLELRYTETGLPVSIRRRGEPEMRYTYTPEGRLESEADSTGRAWRYEYDSRGNVLREHFHGRVTSYAYDAQDRLVAVTDPAGAVTRYLYDTAGRRTGVTDALGGTTRFEYDVRGRLTSETNAAGRVTRYRYDPFGRVTGITYPGGASRSFIYGRTGKLLREVNPLGGVTRYDYDGAGQLVRVTDPVNRVWIYEYSAPGQVSRKIGPSGTAVRLVYDSRRRKTGLVDDAGETVRFERDSRGRIARIHLPGGMVRSITYDSAGRPVAEESNLSARVEREFDEARRLVRERRATGAETTFRYDSWGGLVERRESDGGVIAYEYDARGLRAAVKDEQGRMARFTYDLLGRLVQVTEAGGGSRRLSWGAGGDLLRVEDANGDTVQLSYDNAGRLSRLRYPGGGVTQFERDPFGNPLKITDPLGAETRFAYDLAGRLRSTVHPDGRTASVQYDAAGRVAEERLADGKTVRRTYTGSGRLISVDDGAFPVRYGYDAAGRRNRIEFPALRQSIGYEFDSAGMLVKLLAPGGHEIRYSYGAHKQLSAITLPDGKEIRFEYDPKGRLKTMDYPNGVRGMWERDAAGRLTGVVYKDASGNPVGGRQYQYDAAGRLSRAIPVPGDASEYRYDPAGQLIEETRGPYAVRYSYLPGGNRASREEDGRRTVYRYNQADQMVAAGGETLAYDRRGNLVQQGGATGGRVYAYDGANRLERVTLPDGGEVSYGYAATGERAWRKDHNGTMWFAGDGVNLIADFDESLAVKTVYVHAPGVDRPLALITAGGTQFYHADALGTITSLTGAKGEVVAAYSTDAFGTPLEMKGQSPNRFIHAGREYDAGTGLYYVRARYYDPRLGRFLSADPASWADPLESNRYAWARNTPTHYTDPTGERAFATQTDIWNAWELTPQQWNNLQAKWMEWAGDSDLERAWSGAEDIVSGESHTLSGQRDALGGASWRSVKGQELYDRSMSWMDRWIQRRTEYRARVEEEALRQFREKLAQERAAAANPTPAAPAEAPARVDSQGRPVASNAPSNPSPDQVEAAGRATRPEPPRPVQNPADRPPDGPELHSPTVKSPPRGAAPGAGGGAPAAPGPRASSFAPQSRIPTIELDGRTLTAWGLGVVGTGLSVAADMEEGRDFTESVKEHAIGAAVGTVLVGLPLSAVAAGTGVLAGVATAGGALLGIGAAGYGVYRYGSAVAERPAREAETAQRHQMNIIGLPMLEEFRNRVDRETGELEALRQRYRETAATVSGNAASIRSLTAGIQGALAAMRSDAAEARGLLSAVDPAAQATGRLAGIAAQLKDWEQTLAQKVTEANNRADACASEADAAQALAAYNEAVGRVAYVVRQADAARQQASGLGQAASVQEAAQRAVGSVQAARDRIVGDAGRVVSLQNQLTQAWNVLSAIRGEFEAKRQALRDHRDKVRGLLPQTLTPEQQNVYLEISRAADIPGLPAEALDESPEVLQRVAAKAVEGRLDAENLAASVQSAAQAPPPAEKPSDVAESIEASASYSIVLLAAAEGVPAKVQACRDRLSSPSDGFRSLGGETRPGSDDNTPPRADAVQNPQTPAQPPADSVSLLNVTPNQPAPDSELVSRSSVRQSMDSAQSQSDRLRQEQRAEQERQMQQIQQAQAQQPARPGFLQVLTAAMSAVQSGMGSPAGFQGAQSSQYFANMMETFRQQHGGQSPSSAQLQQLLNTIRMLQTRTGGGQAGSVPQNQPQVSSLSQNQRFPQPPANAYEQQLRQLGQVMSGGLRTPQAPTQQAQGQKQPPGAAVTAPPAVTPPSRPAATPQPAATQPPRAATAAQPAASPPSKTPAQAQPAAAQPALSCEQQSCQQCIAGKMGAGEFAHLSCSMCIWANRIPITRCQRRLAKVPNYDDYYPTMTIYCSSWIDKSKGLCAVMRMEWEDLRPSPDPDWILACQHSPGQCCNFLHSLRYRGAFDSAAWKAVKFVMPEGFSIPP